MGYTGSREAVMVADRRGITFSGDCSLLEAELYSGRIADDQQLLARARDMGASIMVDDGRVKAWSLDEEVLVGEVTEISRVLEKRRRLYLIPGGFLMAEIIGGQTRINSRGRSSCLVLGNLFTRSRAEAALNSISYRVSLPLLEEIMRAISSQTASVSRDFLTFQSTRVPKEPYDVLESALLADCRLNGWSLCPQQ